jgi:hypothetical protein
LRGETWLIYGPRFGCLMLATIWHLLRTEVTNFFRNSKHLADHWCSYCHVISVNIDGVWIGNQIHWTPTQLVTANNYDSLTELHIINVSCNYSTNKVFSGFTSRCLVAASNNWRSSSSGFPNYPHASATSFSHLTTETLNYFSTTQNKSQTYFMTGGLPPVFSSWRQTPWGSLPEIYFSWTHAVIVLM